MVSVNWWLLFKIYFDHLLPSLTSKNFWCESFHFSFLASLIISSVTMAVSVWQRNTMILQLDMDSGLSQEVHITQNSWFHWKASADHKKCAKQVCWRWLRSRPGFMMVRSHSTQQQDTITRWTIADRELKMTLPGIIRPAPNSEDVRASVRSRQDYRRYDAHAK